MPVLKRMTALVLRLAIVLLLLMAIFDVSIPVTSTAACRVLLLDLSDSLHGRTADRGQTLRAMLSNLPAYSLPGLDRQDFVGMVTFARGVSVEQRPVPREQFHPPSTLTSHLDTTDTDLAEAFSIACALFPGDMRKEVMLFSDGRMTHGSVEDMVLLARSRGVTVHSVPVGAGEPRDVRMIDVAAPGRVLPDASFEATLFLTTTYDTAARVSIESEGKTLASSEVTLAKGKTTSLTFPNLKFTASAPTQRFTSRCHPYPEEDDYSQNNLFDWTVSRQEDRATILLVHREPSSSAAARWLSASNLFSIQVASTLQDPFMYDAVVLDDYDLSTVPMDQMLLLRRYVEDGGGALFILGGPHSFALGGYRGTPVEEIMPVWAAPDERLSLAILLDRSGSMAETLPRSSERKFDVAVQAVESAVKVLAPNDSLAALLFANQVDPVLPLQPMTSDPGLGPRLRSVSPGGSTHILEAVRAGLQQMRQARTGRRHLLLITDGQDTSGAPTEEFARLKSELELEQISMTVIATGAAVDDERLRALAGDRIHREQDLKKLEALLKQDLVVRKNLIHSADHPLKVEIKNASPILSGISTIPPIARCNNTTPKEQALVILTADGAPLLVQKPAGKGMSAVLTTNGYEEWAPEWNTWTEGSVLLTNIVSSMVHAQRPSAARIEHRRDGRRIAVTVSSPAEEIRSLDYFNPEAPHTGTIPMEPGGFGRTEGTIEDIRPGTYFMKIYGAASELKYTVSVPYSAEFDHVGLNLETLQKLAEGTGGTMLLQPSDMISSAQPSPVTYRSGRRVFLLTALAMFLFDLMLMTFWKARS